MDADRLTSQLVEVADVVGDLGRNIAAAQKLMNKDYVESVKALMRMVADTLGQTADDAERAQFMMAFLKALAPNRYQYTETTIDFSADLAEAKQSSKMIGGGATFKMLQVNAAMTMGYGHEYRASARITATLHAYADPHFADQLLAQAAELSGEGRELPLGTSVDQEIYNGVTEVWRALGTSSTGAV